MAGTGFGYNAATLKTKTIRGLVNSGADLMKNMYDVRLWLPNFSVVKTVNAEQQYLTYPLTVRAEGFKVPDVDMEVHPIAYHGVEIEMPSTKINMTREVELTFREDAAFNLRQIFTTWHAMVADPVTGGVSNTVQFLGKMEVAALANAYIAPTVEKLETDPPTSTDTKQLGGSFIAGDAYNGLAIWAFYNVWVKKVNGVDFSTGSSDPGQIAVTFKFQDFDAPFYAGNTLNSNHDADWAGTATSGLNTGILTSSQSAVTAASMLPSEKPYKMGVS
jgi:hypothetical protein